ncbi:hypothetical protein DL96DRAFT_1811846 [Flagelloscypha sp. PMI_526]|nr:hypothetical protein DL96DRAFT_1811846 [Flagelloscypha sp. PMI_526]
MSIPRLAQLVRRYAHREDWSNFLPNTGIEGKEIDRQFWEIHIPEMLRAFTNLKTLILGRRGGAACANVLDECQFQLDTLSWGSAHTETRLMSFLETQHEITEFHLHWKEHIPRPPPHILRALVSLAATCFSTIAMFLPGRTVQHLSWDPHTEDPKEYELVQEISKYPGLVDAFRNIIYLSVGGYFAGPPFEALIPSLPKLIVLEIRGKAVQSPRSVKDLPALRGVLFFGPSFFPYDREDRKKLKVKLSFVVPHDARGILQDMSGIQ